jgi:hypothetical protein
MGLGKLADLFVEVGVKDDTARGLGRVRSMLGTWAGEAKRALTLPVMIAGGVAGAALGKFLWDSVQAAGNLNETMSKVGVTFGNSAGQVVAFADQMANSFGLVKREVLDAASAFGLILQGSGMTADASAELSIQLAKLAADASSFYNVPVAEALEKIRSGLVGEAEPLRAFGVLLSEGAVQAKAAEMGFEAMGGKFTEAAKSAARSQLIIEGLTKASGDLERTSDSLSNRQKKLAGDFDNLKASIGASLVDPMRELIGLMYELGGAVNDAFNGQAVEKFSGAIGGLSDAIKNMRSGDSSGTMKPGGILDNKVGRFAAGGFLGTLEAVGLLPAHMNPMSVARGRKEGAKALAEQLSGAAAGATPGIAAAGGGGAGVPMRRVDTDAFGFGMLMGQRDLESMILAGAAQQYAGAGIGGKLKDERAKLADMEQSRRDRLAQGGVMGDQLSSISSMQNELLNDLPRQQLEETKNTVKKLDDILVAIKEGDMGAVRAGEAILAE